MLGRTVLQYYYATHSVLEIYVKIIYFNTYNRIKKKIIYIHANLKDIKIQRKRKCCIRLHGRIRHECWSDRLNIRYANGARFFCYDNHDGVAQIP